MKKLLDDESGYLIEYSYGHIYTEKYDYSKKDLTKQECYSLLVEITNRQEKQHD